MPWWQLVWVTWRQHRAGVVTMVALLGGLSLILAFGPGSNYGGPGTMIPLYRFPALLAGLIPGLAGMLAGSPLLARELAQRSSGPGVTTAGGRARLVCAKLVVLAITLTVPALAVGMLFLQWLTPLVIEGTAARLSPGLFAECGIVPAAWTLFSFALGALAGAVARRRAVAMTAAGAGCAVFALLVAGWLPAHLFSMGPAVVTADNGYISPPPSSYQVATGLIQPGGHWLSGAASNDLMVRKNVASPPDGADRFLASHHYRYWTTYQPVSRFWIFQSVAAAFLLLLSLIVGATTIWLVRRRLKRPG
jgi:ABC-2 family transporter protein